MFLNSCCKLSLCRVRQTQTQSIWSLNKIKGLTLSRSLHLNSLIFNNQNLNPNPSESNELILYGTPLSHFTRKIRILLHEYNIPFNFKKPKGPLVATDQNNDNHNNNNNPHTNNLNTLNHVYDPSLYLNNPLMRVPTLYINNQLLIESDHIARYIVFHYQHKGGYRGDNNNNGIVDPFNVLTFEPKLLNNLSILNGIMSNEVILILTKRSGITDSEINNQNYFIKLVKAIEHSLLFINNYLLMNKNNLNNKDMSYNDIVLICMWQHLEYYNSLNNNKESKYKADQDNWLNNLLSKNKFSAIEERVGLFAHRPSVFTTSPEQSLLLNM